MRGTCLAFAVLALSFAGVPAAEEEAKDAVSPYFARVKDEGLVLSCHARRDGTADVDVYSEKAVTRYRFNAKGEVQKAPSPAEYSPKTLAKVKTSAADAVKAALKRYDPRAAEVRAVEFLDEYGQGVYAVSVYDAGEKFYGCHRFLAKDGSWDGWSDALGEVDPLSRKETDGAGR